MGNRAKRVKLAKALKEHGFGRLYTGNKRVAWGMLWANHMDELLLKLRFKKGDVANDCDGLNHRVVEWLVERREFHHWREGVHKGWVFSMSQFIREDGCYSCGCPSGPEPAKTREEIESYFLEVTDEHIEDLKRQKWWTELAERRLQALRRGEHVCDEQGTILQEYSAYQ